MKKIVRIVFSAVFAFAFMSAGCKKLVEQSAPSTPSDETSVDNYVTPKEDFIYTTNNGEITITGFLDALATRVVIPEIIDGLPVTRIANLAFISNNTIGSVTAPSVLQIEAGTLYLSRYGAFASCLALTNVSFPNVTNIGCNAFFMCFNLIIANFPEITTIGAYSFFECGNLAIANFPKVTTIGDWAFYFCTNLANINFSEATTIGESAFFSCYNLAAVNVPKVTSVNTQTFRDCLSLTTVNFPEVAAINREAFSGCIRLQSVNFPKATTIGDSAFYMCTNLTNGLFGALTNIGSAAFQYCSSLVSFTVGDAVLAAFVSDAFYGTLEKTLYVPLGTENNYGAWKIRFGFTQVLPILL